VNAVLELPYAAPLRAVDSVAPPRSEVDGRLAVRASKAVTAGEPYLAGHFPGFPIYPGVFAVESVRQAVAHAVGRPLDVSLLASVRFLAPLLPGNVFAVEADVTRAGDAYAVAARCVRDDGTEAARLRAEFAAVPPGRVAGTRPVVGGAMSLGPADLRALLPHRHPMLLVDRVTAGELGVALAAEKAVGVGEPCYAGLRDDAPAAAWAYPASLLVESFGQAAAVLWQVTTGEPATAGGRVLMLAAARQVRIEGIVLPGDVLRHVVRIENVVGDNAFVAGETWVGERRVASMGSLVAVVRPRAAVLAAEPTTTRRGVLR
jgi:3-hydroxyacyl-[acyl-carrier-protein] dehydratase